MPCRCCSVALPVIAHRILASADLFPSNLIRCTSLLFWSLPRRRDSTEGTSPPRLRFSSPCIRLISFAWLVKAGRFDSSAVPIFAIPPRVQDIHRLFGSILVRSLSALCWSRPFHFVSSRRRSSPRRCYSRPGMALPFLFQSALRFASSFLVSLFRAAPCRAKPRHAPPYRAPRRIPCLAGPRLDNPSQVPCRASPRHATPSRAKPCRAPRPAMPSPAVPSLAGPPALHRLHLNRKLPKRPARLRTARTPIPQAH